MSKKPTVTIDATQLEAKLAQFKAQKKLGLNLKKEVNRVALSTKPIATSSSSLMANEGYDLAVSRCRAKVKEISRICQDSNTVFRDRYFDLDFDRDQCLLSLLSFTTELKDPPGVKRVRDIFDKPQFFANETLGNNNIQGDVIGDCHLIAAISTLSSQPQLLLKTMIERDEEVGVYGFVFFRDGKWISSIVDDQLYVKAKPHAEAGWVKDYMDEKEYEASFIKGSKSLYFSRCANEHETWLPLLEKAYAKAHGDYSCIEGGWSGEAVEDLTGGIYSPIILSDVLDRDRFWNEELAKANTDRIFFVSTFDNHEEERIASAHAYSVLKTVE
ncbi:UNVERIFIED_CONTAM: hypothetical protein HDU68_001450, partial [Siphonaria sp. JEL0065]